MSETNKYKLISGILALVITFPIWFYLLYSILKLVNATELMMFLFWVYVPVQILILIIAKIGE